MPAKSLLYFRSIVRDAGFSGFPDDRARETYFTFICDLLSGSRLMAYAAVSRSFSWCDKPSPRSTYGRRLIFAEHLGHCPGEYRPQGTEVLHRCNARLSCPPLSREACAHSSVPQGYTQTSRHGKNSALLIAECRKTVLAELCRPPACRSQRPGNRTARRPRSEADRCSASCDSSQQQPVPTGAACNSRLSHE